ncbi:MAG: hypothetical protein HY000_40535 [Planctomycetes bacterium]|nr:hypothetical protein [Planctomycetota bacterium]
MLAPELHLSSMGIWPWKGGRGFAPEHHVMPAKKLNAGKPTAKKRSANIGRSKSTASEGAPFNELDPKRRRGNFSGAGEHARVGGRTTGIVGQTTKTFTAKRKPK